ncbi:MAG: DctP family TRAP transporter solute-binding subunit [SAR324 cluster bacterium]|nr:DctP family TRAP transporter solute-binding subunit [SAR324 cluster bacterium]
MNKKHLLSGITAIFVLFLLVLELNWITGSTDLKEKKLTGTPEPFHLQFGHDMAPDSAQHIAALRFADIVNYKSRGNIVVEVFPNQSLGTDEQMIERLLAGTLAISLPPTAKMSFLEPAVQYPDLPFFFKNREQLYEMLDGEPGQLLSKLLNAHGLTCPTFWESGFKQFTANKEIHRPEDFRGLNFRVMKSPLLMEQYRLLGAVPIPIDFSQTYSALSDGNVSGQENPIGSIAGMKFYEIQKYLILSNHAYLAQALCFSNKILTTLPGDLQKILVETAVELTGFQRQEILKRETEQLKTIRAHGTQVYELTTEEKARFQQALMPVIDSYRKVGGEFLELTRLLVEKKERLLNNEILIGLDADMIAGSAQSGIAIQRGAELAIEDINHHGGVLGKRLKLVVRNNSGVAAIGLENIRYFATLPNLVAVLGGLHSQIVLLGMETIHQNQLIYLGPWGAATGLTEQKDSPGYVFRVSANDKYVGPFLVAEALKNYKRPALLLNNNLWGRSNQKALQEALNARQIEPAAIEWFNNGEPDMSIQLKRIEAAQADVILLIANAPEGVTIVHNMARQKNILPIISHWGITGGNFWEEAHQDLEKVPFQFIQTFSFLTHLNPRAEDLKTRYLKKYEIADAEKIEAPVGIAHAWDLIHLLALAIKQAGTLERSKIRDALENLPPYDGVVQRYAPAFTATQHDGLNPEHYFLAEFDKSGAIVPVGHR